MTKENIREEMIQMFKLLNKNYHILSIRILQDEFESMAAANKVIYEELSL